MLWVVEFNIFPFRIPLSAKARLGEVLGKAVDPCYCLSFSHSPRCTWPPGAHRAAYNVITQACLEVSSECASFLGDTVGGLMRLPGLSLQPLLHASSPRATRGSAVLSLLAWQGRRAFSGTGGVSQQEVLLWLIRLSLFYALQGLRFWNSKPSCHFCSKPCPWETTATRVQLPSLGKSYRVPGDSRRKKKYHWLIFRNHILVHQT